MTVDFITETLIDLVKINSVNPSLEKGGIGEIEIGNSYQLGE